MPTTRAGAVALLTGGALWAQLAGIPIVLAVVHHEAPLFITEALALLALGVLGTAFQIAPRRPRLACDLALAGFPIALGLFAISAGFHPFARFELAGRLIGAATVLVFAVAAIRWAQSLSPVAVATLAPLEARTPGRPAPPLRGAALALVGFVAAFLAIVAPALVAARSALTRSDRIAGLPLVRAREALTSAGGLALALIVVLGAGGALLRGRAARRRRMTRGLAYLIWGVAALGLEILLDLQR